ncbi:MAG: hypothetical protein WD768_05585 [Phycisphaeraceae bacterium]
MMHSKAIHLLIRYAAATACCMVFYYAFIPTHKLFASNDIVGPVAALSMCFIIPFVGVIHLSRLTLRRERVWRMIGQALLIGLVGPFVLLVTLVIEIELLGNAEAAFGFLLVPIAFLAFGLVGYLALLIWQCTKGRPDDRLTRPSDKTAGHTCR